MEINSVSSFSGIFLDLLYKEIIKPNGEWDVSMILFVLKNIRLGSSLALAEPCHIIASNDLSSLCNSIYSDSALTKCP